MNSDLTLEKLKIHERLASLEARQQAADEILNEIRECLVGNGNPGMKTRIDRLEQTEKGRKFQFNTLWTAMVGTFIVAAFNSILDYLKGR